MGKSSVTIRREKKTFLAALTSSLGVVTDASKECEIAGSNHYLWYNEDEQYRNDVDEIANVALDFVESALFDNVKKKKERSIIFYMERKGRIRGFHNTLDVTTGGPLFVHSVVAGREQKGA